MKMDGFKIWCQNWLYSLGITNKNLRIKIISMKNDDKFAKWIGSNVKIAIFIADHPENNGMQPTQPNESIKCNNKSNGFSTKDKIERNVSELELN